MNVLTVHLEMFKMVSFVLSVFYHNKQNLKRLYIVPFQLYNILEKVKSQRQ